MRLKLLPFAALAIMTTGCSNKPLPAVQPPPTLPQTTMTAPHTVYTSNAPARLDMHGPMPDAYRR